MAEQFSYRDTVARDNCDAIVDACDAGTGAAIIIFYDGTMPTDASTALSGNNEVATLVMSDPAFGNATLASPSVATAGSITQDSSATGGTPTFFRVYDTNDGATPLDTADAVLQGTAGTVDVNAVLSNGTIANGATVSCSSFTVSVPRTQ